MEDKPEPISTPFLSSNHVMAGQHGYQTKHVRLVALLVLVCLAAGFARRVMPFPQSLSSSSSEPRSDWSTRGSRELVQPNLNPDPPTPPRLNRIHGRWEAVRASLGLPSLPQGPIVFTPRPDSALPGRSDKRASRFDLGRKRRVDEAVRRLHFAYDTRPAQPDETAAPGTSRQREKVHRPPDSPNQ